MPQGLPCTIGYIEAKPILKTDNVRGILLGEFPVQYDAFDDQVASGNIYKLPLIRKINKYNKNIED